ncbi:MAG TPA: DUF1643 domain-containing protein [Alcanivorax sp.]|nr:DUF1643 domain-containing protein [Alcanivorax sp.]
MTILGGLCAGWPEPIGRDNDRHIVTTCTARDVRLVVAAWGARGEYHGRASEVCSLLAQHQVPVHHLGLTQAG